MSRIVRSVKRQSRIVPSFVHPRRTPADQLRSTQFETVTRSHALSAASDRLFARTTIASSPVVMSQFAISTSREQLTWMPSLFGYRTSASILQSRKETRSQSWIQ